MGVGLGRRHRRGRREADGALVDDVVRAVAVGKIGFGIQPYGHPAELVLPGEIDRQPVEVGTAEGVRRKGVLEVEVGYLLVLHLNIILVGADGLLPQRGQIPNYTDCPLMRQRSCS